MEILNYKSVNQGALIASFDLCVKKWGDLVIKDIKLFRKDARKWISFPSDKVEVLGETKYFPKLYFKDKNMMGSFTQKVLDAVDEFAKKQAQELPSNDETSEIPF